MVIFSLIVMLGATAQGAVYVDGKPADGIAVYAISHDNLRNVESTTRKDGEFEIELPRTTSGRWTIVGVYEGRGETVAYVPGVRSRIEIPPPATLSGRFDPSIEEEATVTVYSIDRPELGSAAWALNIVAGGSPRRAKTLIVGPPGTFRVSGLQPGEYRISASRSDMAGVVDFHAKPGRESEVVVPVGAVGGITGEVRERDTAKRIGGGMIYLRSPERDSSVGIAVMDGRFADLHLLPGKYFIRVTTNDMREIGDEEPVTIRPGETTTVILHHQSRPTPKKLP